MKKVMKTVSIYIDIRKSKELTLMQKKEIYKKMYNQFSKLDLTKDNVGHRINKFLGDGIIFIFNADSLNNGKDLIEIMQEINQKVKDFEIEQEIEIGIGISYSKAFEEGNKDLFISPSIDGATYGVSLANKFLIKDQYWKWVLPLKIPKNDDGSIKELKNVIENEETINYHKTQKNLWFEFD